MATDKKILRVLHGERMDIPPVWLMRQAGRYLPEYQEVRAKAGGFLELVFNPALAAEVTLQPIRRFGFDAAILFSDILIVPQVLGCSVHFGEGEGPRLQPVSDDFINRLAEKKFNPLIVNPIYETVARIHQGLVDEGFEDTALIGFAGAPWTVACYMIEGGSSKDYALARHWVQHKPEALARLIDSLIEVTAFYLIEQIKSGAEIVQIFDSWAGLLPTEQEFRQWVIEPTRKIVDLVKTQAPDIPVIGFPRGAGPLYKIYIEESGVNAVGLDQHVTLNKAQRYQARLPVQGNLDPEILKTGEGLEKAVQEIISSLSQGPHIFNLGHGIIKETPPANVERLVQTIRRI